MINGKQKRADQVFHVDKVPFNGIPIRAQHNGDGLPPLVFIRLLSPDQIPPAWSRFHLA